MVKKLVYLTVVLTILVLIGLDIWLLMQRRNYQPDIPASALNGMDANTTKSIAYFELADWASGVSSDAYISVFKGELFDTNETEMRVFLDDGENTYYVGVLSDELGLAGIKTIFIDLGKERCILGWVPSSLNKPIYFRIERSNPNKESEWQDAKKESTVDKGIADANGGWFIVPIKNDIQLWNTLAKSAIQTSDSLDRGSKDLGSWYEVEKTYSPSLDVSSWYIHVPIQK